MAKKECAYWLRKVTEEKDIEAVKFLQNNNICPVEIENKTVKAQMFHNFDRHPLKGEYLNFKIYKAAPLDNWNDEYYFAKTIVHKVRYNDDCEYEDAKKSFKAAKLGTMGAIACGTVITIFASKAITGKEQLGYILMFMGILGIITVIKNAKVNKKIREIVDKFDVVERYEMTTPGMKDITKLFDHIYKLNMAANN